MDTLTMKDKTQKKVQNIAQTILENTKAFGVLLARLEDGFFHNIAYVGYNHLVVKTNKVVNQMEANAVDFLDLLNEPV